MGLLVVNPGKLVDWETGDPVYPQPPHAPLSRLSPVVFGAPLFEEKQEGRGMALEASADLSIFPWPAPGNLHLVNWEASSPPVQALCFSIELFGRNTSYRRETMG